MDHFYEKIPGNFTFADLYRKFITEAPEPSTIVEVGVWHGRSAAFMGVEIVNSGKDLAFYCVDLWEKTPIPESDYKSASLAEFSRDVGMRFAGLDCICKPLQMDSAKGADAFEDNELFAVFIDANHAYEAVLADILAWLPKIEVGGYLAGHDYDPYYPWVIKAADDLFSTDNVHANECGQKSWCVKITEEVRARALAIAAAQAKEKAAT